MIHLQHTKEVLASWRRCVEIGLPNNILSPVMCLNKTDMGELLKKNKLLISIFEDCIDISGDLLPAECAFLLVDSQGILLKKNKTAK